MPSKGVDVYSYISVPGYTIQFSVPGTTLTHSSTQNFTRQHLEISSQDPVNHVSRFEWTVRSKTNTIIASKYNDIDTITGLPVSGTMLSTQEFLPIITDEVIITYCFYSAGPSGNTNLPTHHQCYITLCSTSNSRWLSSFAPPGSPSASLPFSALVLSSPHDPGMNTLRTCSTIFPGLTTETIQTLFKPIPEIPSLPQIPDSVLLSRLPDIVYNTAITQKKGITDMLRLGARYFEFRPARLVPGFLEASGGKVRDTFYFQHGCIHGMAFDRFLKEVVWFLGEEEGVAEIVVVHVRFDDVVAQCERLTRGELVGMLDQACREARVPLQWGEKQCFKKSIDALRAEGTRLIVLMEEEKYDSYDARAYATLTPDPILRRFEGMTTEGQSSTDLTVLQCQATSQRIPEVMVHSILSANAANSCLTSTKASNDIVLLPWIQENALERLRAERLVVVMNDFIDGATADLCIELSRRRLQVG